MKSLSRARLLATPWTAAYQAPPSMGFSRQEYWSGVPLLKALIEDNTAILVNSNKILLISHQNLWMLHGSEMIYSKCWKAKPSAKNIMSNKAIFKNWGQKIDSPLPIPPHKPLPPPPPAGSPVSIKSSGGDNGYSLQYSCLENPRGACLAMVHRVIKNQTWQKQLARHVHIIYYTCTYMFALSKNRHFQTFLAKTLQALFQKLPNICIWQYCHFLSDLFLFSFQKEWEDPLQHETMIGKLKYGSFKPTGI